MQSPTTATKRVALALITIACLFSVYGQALAQGIGQVINLSGPLFVIKADGTRRVLSMGSSVEAGDTLATEEKTYARIKFIDTGELTLRPGTRFKVESYSFTQAEPAKDSAAFSLFKGALRTITGLVGKRGNQDAYRMATPTATIGIRGTQFLAEFVPLPDAAPRHASHPSYALPLLAALDPVARETRSDMPQGLFSLLPDPLLVAQAGPGSTASVEEPGRLAPGLYLQVLEGLVQLSNQGGVETYAAGQFGYVGSQTAPPQRLPANPGIEFEPPPAFNSPTPADGAPLPSSYQRSSSQDSCEVR